MNKLHVLISIGLVLVFPILAVVMHQFPDQKAEIEKFRQSVLNQIADYLPEQKCEPQRRRG